MATDNLGYAVGVILAEMLTGGFIIGTARCRNFSFPPMMPIELAMDLAVADTVEKIKRHQKGQLHLATQNEAEAWKKRITTWKAYK